MSRKQKKRRKPGPQFHYLPDAKWQDVLAGKPVTVDDKEKAERRKGKRPSRCRACGRLNMVGDLIKPCEKCGGKLYWLP